MKSSSRRARSFESLAGDWEDAGAAHADIENAQTSAAVKELIRGLKFGITFATPLMTPLSMLASAPVAGNARNFEV